MHFQVDTGAQCNVVATLRVVSEATKDYKMKHVFPTNSSINSSGWTSPYPCMARRLLIVDAPKIRPLLGRKACVGMKIVSYLPRQ